MTSQGNGQSPVYDVRQSEQNKKELLRLHSEFAQRGEGKIFVTPVRQVFTRLRADPVNFGEPLFRLPALKLTVYHVVVARLVVEYGVHDERPWFSFAATNCCREKANCRRHPSSGNCISSPPTSRSPPASGRQSPYPAVVLPPSSPMISPVM